MGLVEEFGPLTMKKEERKPLTCECPLTLEQPEGIIAVIGNGHPIKVLTPKVLQPVA